MPRTERAGAFQKQGRTQVSSLWRGISNMGPTQVSWHPLMEITSGVQLWQVVSNGKGCRSSITGTGCNIPPLSRWAHQASYCHSVLLPLPELVQLSLPCTAVCGVNIPRNCYYYMILGKCKTSFMDNYVGLWD